MGLTSPLCSNGAHVISTNFSVPLQTARRRRSQIFPFLSVSPRIQTIYFWSHAYEQKARAFFFFFFFRISTTARVLSSFFAKVINLQSISSTHKSSEMEIRYWIFGETTLSLLFRYLRGGLNGSLLCYFLLRERGIGFAPFGAEYLPICWFSRRSR